MPGPAETQAASTDRTVFALRGVIEATGLHICTAGDDCAVHLQTRRGRYVVRVPLHIFCEAARAPHDCNGRPFPDLGANPKGRAEIVERELAADAAALPLAPRPEIAADQSRTHPRVNARLKLLPYGQRIAMYRAAYDRKVANPKLTLAELADEIGISAPGLHHHFERFARGETQPPNTAHLKNFSP
jgi:hypothetical protein